ncbi:MAG: aldehyde dehydrogenase family protein [Woeseiaceae bacterium]|jgi:aldehyde dehydrogenase (NAD+)|nr:aldehyde dehydrogenase family protein [Woeseiaceae bacterium]
MKNLNKFYINGDWVTPISTDTFPVTNPANEEIVGTIAMGNQEDVNIAVEAANEAFITYSTTSKEERLNLFKKLREVTMRRYEELAQAITCEMGAPISMSRDAQTDAAIGHLDGFITALEQHKEKTTLDNGDILIKEPIGVCGLITPWNWPINQITLKVLPALAAGCTCILKPSEHTPLSAMIYAEIIHEAGFPPGVFNLVNGDGPRVGAALSKHNNIQMMSFTGSTRAGKNVTCDAAESIKRVTLELGGKSPNIVFSDCNLEEQITASINECMFNTGQSCDAPTRLLVEESCYKDVIALAKSSGESVVVGDPLEEGDHIGPLFDKIQFDRVQNLIQAGINEGAKLLVGGLDKPSGFEAGWYVKPTIFVNVTNDMRVAQEEIFGPVLVIIPFKDEAEAIKIANDTPYGLAAYIQTGDSVKAERVAMQLRAGAIHINGGEFNYGSPFGGYKQSGNGREGGSMGLEDYFETKTLHYA